MASYGWRFGAGRDGLMSRLNRWSAWMAACFLVLLPLVGVCGEPASHDIRPGYGVSELRWLSDYLPALAGTPGDTQIYVMRGEAPGGTLLLLGGTHPSEIAGTMAATLLVERGEAAVGTVLIVPHTNNSAARANTPYLIESRGEMVSIYPFEGSWISLTTESGELRSFRYGSRFTQPEDQGAEDPEVYVHLSGRESMGADARNLDRVHPGLADGTLTQQISYALFQLVEKEAVDVVIDMHESAPKSSLAHTLICHPRALDTGTMALFDLELEGVYMKLEISRPEHAGISHWEFGENTDALSFLIETPNPGQDWSFALPHLAARTGTGSEEEAETQASPETPPEVDVINDPEHPISSRVYEQLSVVRAILSNHALSSASDQAIEIGFSFGLEELIDADLGRFLR